MTSPIHNNLPGSDIYSLHFAGSNPANQNNTQSQVSLFGDDGFTFGDLIDIVNPLQHIPIINKIYQKLTGDTIAPLMQIAGGALYGGPIGAVASLVTAAIDEYAAANTNSEPVQIGVDPATVAGTYPFAQPESNPEPDQTGVNAETISNHSPVQDPDTITMGMRYGDGIYNPATANNNSHAYAQVKIDNTADLYAGLSPVENRSGALSSSWFVNKTYNGSNSIMNNKPQVDVMLGEHS